MDRRQLLGIVTVGALAFAAAADEADTIPRPEKLIDAKHEAIFDSYEEALRAADSAAQIDRQAAGAALTRSVDLHLLRVAESAGAERVGELRKIAANWSEEKPGEEVPEELAPIVAGYRRQLENVAAALAETRASAGDQLIVALDDYALGFEKLPDGKQTTVALRAEIRKLLARSGPARKFGELEVTTRHWKDGDPWFVRMNFHGDELLALSRITGCFAGGGENLQIGYWDDGLTLGYLGKSMQRGVAGSAYALRHPKLDVRRWKIRTAGVLAWEERTAKLVHKSRGFAYAGGISGSFADDCRFDVTLNPDDGFYYAIVEPGRGNTVGGTAVVVEFPQGEAPDFELSSATWQRGEPTRELIDAKDGICLLTSVFGAIKGTSEEISLKVGADGKWRLGGRSTKAATGATAMIIRFKD